VVDFQATSTGSVNQKNMEDSKMEMPQVKKEIEHLLASLAPSAQKTAIENALVVIRANIA
jgi:hypothetical protein